MRQRWSILLAFAVCFCLAAQKPDDNRFFPGNTQAVITVNVRQIMESPLVKKDLPKLQEHMKSNAEVSKRMTALGFDPAKDLDSVTVAAAGVEDQEQVVIVARGKFDPAKFKAMADEMAKEQKDAFKVHQVNGQTLYEVSMQGQRPMFVALIDGNTIVAGMKQSDVSDAFEIKAGKKKGELRKELQGLLSKANPKHSLSVVMLGAALGNGVPFADKVEHLDGGITLSDEIKTSFLITTKDAESAKGLAELLQQGIEQAKGLIPIIAGQQKELAPLADVVDVLKIDTKDNTVTIKGDVTKDAIEKLQKKQ